MNINVDDILLQKHLPKGPLWRSTISFHVEVRSDVASIYEYFSVNEFMSTLRNVC
jgi:hypothetical protein